MIAREIRRALLALAGIAAYSLLAMILAACDVARGGKWGAP